ncbi:MAG: nucleotidyl transferase AbiEii/AbiGii toxin family protein [Leptospirales bacterium]
MQALDSLIRPPLPETERYYLDILYPLQDRVLKISPWPEGWVLSGGTAISRFMSEHRFSDDLDFFFYNHEPELFMRHCHRLDGMLRESGLTIQSEVDNDYFRRIFVADESGNHLKIECILEPRKTIGNFQSVAGIKIDSPENLAVNKINAILGRNLIRDLYDLWHLEETVPFPKALDLSEQAYGSPLVKTDLLAVADRIRVPGTIPVHATRTPDLGGFAEYLGRVSEEVIRRITIEAEKIKKKLPESVESLFWDAIPPHSPIDRFNGEPAARILEYGSSALLAALPPTILMRLAKKAGRPIRVSQERLLLIEKISGWKLDAHFISQSMALSRGISRPNPFRCDRILAK